MNIPYSYVLKDLREDETRYCTKRLKDFSDWKDPEKRLSLYLSNKQKDADHWFAEVLETYKKYPIFEKSLETRPGRITYKQNGKEVRLTADLLTNADAVSRWVNNHPDFCDKEENHQILRDFYFVSYTIGNFSPIWKNPPPGRDNGMDNIWNKLPIPAVDIKAWKSVFNREDKNINNLRNRKKTGLFMILSEGSPIDLINQLFFVDYYDYYWSLLYRNDIDITKLESDEFAEFIKKSTVLTVQRSYRIFAKYRGNVLREEDKNKLKEILKQLEYKHYKHIYSKKMKVK
ncbi:MAG: hypothetical protein K6A38_01545 [Lachnospiraceae bacterium]|nr:hypothetical protein [Lachnospiraceae bacterium]